MPLLTMSSFSVELFLAARRMTDITDCRDTTSLQALVFIIVFLQCSSRMSTCYTYLGIALRSAIQMGLHRRLITTQTPIERQTRSKLFWVLRKMDIYVSALLGLPCNIVDDDIDQDMPLEIDDEGLVEGSSHPQCDQRLTQMAATNAHIRLTEILKRVVANVYPVKGGEQTHNGSSEVYLVEDWKIGEIEVALRRWSDTLPERLQPSARIFDRLSRHVKVPCRNNSIS